MAYRFPMDVSFPGLGLEFTVDNVCFSIGNFDIYWYAVIICSGLVLALVYAYFNHKRFDINLDHLIDVVFISIFFGIIGARLYYVLFNIDQYDSFGEVINIRDGGLGIYGGVICAFAAAFITCRIKKIDFFSIADLAGMGFLIGQGIGRWGNFVNQEAFGGPTDLPWGMLSANTRVVVDGPVHPCFFYESMWCLAGFYLLFFLSRKWYVFRGQYFLLYILWYGLGRVWIEGLRTDSLWLIPDVIRISQLIAGLSLLTVPLIILGLKGKLFKQVERS